MCGIIGAISKNKNIVPYLIEGLKRLEYRGYDSAGVTAIVNHDIEIRRSVGKISELENLLNKEPLESNIGIGHTRWATHGKPSVRNAHPHASNSVVLVHNGIIENYSSLKKSLEQKGYEFSSDTDTETVVHLIEENLKKGKSPLDATKASIKQLEGSFALGIIFKDYPDLMIGAKKGSPLAVGINKDTVFLGSDAIALSIGAEEIAYLEDGDIVEIKKHSFVVYDKNGKTVKREMLKNAISSDNLSKGDYDHYMLKEIHEQPIAITKTFSSLIDNQRNINIDITWHSVSKITIVARGTAFYSGLVSKYWFEQLSKISVECDVASEFRYREAAMEKGGLTIVISQSGETADTLAALKYAKSQGQKILSIVNVQQSSIARLSDIVIPTLAGAEIGVASTKAFTNQLIVLLMLALSAAKQKKTIDASEIEETIAAIGDLPSLIGTVLQESDAIKKIAKKIKSSRSALYLGRGSLYPIALEGALKLKEISYIHAEGYPAGEMKHGPIALIDNKMPIIVLAPNNDLFDKIASNIQEVSARDGKIILVSDQEGFKKLKKQADYSIIMPNAHKNILPILYVIPLQILAYWCALARGTDVDQPRNLAKSVTVE